MLPRIKKRSDFVRVSKNGCYNRTTHMTVQCFKDTEPFSFVRVGFTASKRVGNAVARNRAKRRLRALVHENLKALLPQNFEFALSFVFIAHPTLVHTCYADAQRDFTCGVRACLNRLHTHTKTIE